MFTRFLIAAISVLALVDSSYSQPIGPLDGMGMGGMGGFAQPSASMMQPSMQPPMMQPSMQPPMMQPMMPGGISNSFGGAPTPGVGMGMGQQPVTGASPFSQPSFGGASSFTSVPGSDPNAGMMPGMTSAVDPNAAGMSTDPSMGEAGLSAGGVSSTGGSSASGLPPSFNGVAQSKIQCQTGQLCTLSVCDSGCQSLPIALSDTSSNGVGYITVNSTFSPETNITATFCIFKADASMPPVACKTVKCDQGGSGKPVATFIASKTTNVSCTFTNSGPDRCSSNVPGTIESVQISDLVGGVNGSTPAAAPPPGPAPAGGSSAGYQNSLPLATLVLAIFMSLY